MITAEDMLKIAEPLIRKQFKLKGEVHPMYRFVNGAGEHCFFVPPAFGSSADKDLTAALARALFEIEGAQAYVFAVEAWTLASPTSADEIDRIYEQHKSLEHAPDRREVVMLAAEDGNVMLQAWMEIHRPKGRKPYLGELEVYGRDPQFEIEGRFVGLLPRKGPMQ